VIAGLGWVLPALPLIAWMSGAGISKSGIRDQKADFDA
jgi:hypothetical protein